MEQYCAESEYCCLCDLSFSCVSDLTCHLESFQHLSGLVQQKLLTGKYRAVLLHLVNEYQRNKELLQDECCENCVDLETFACHLVCPVKQSVIQSSLSASGCQDQPIAASTDDPSASETLVEASGNSPNPCNDRTGCTEFSERYPLRNRIAGASLSESGERPRKRVQSREVVGAKVAKKTRMQTNSSEAVDSEGNQFVATQDVVEDSNRSCEVESMLPRHNRNHSCYEVRTIVTNDVVTNVISIGAKSDSNLSTAVISDCSNSLNEVIPDTDVKSAVEDLNTIDVESEYAGLVFEEVVEQKYEADEEDDNSQNQENQQQSEQSSTIKPEPNEENILDNNHNLTNQNSINICVEKITSLAASQTHVAISESESFQQLPEEQDILISNLAMPFTATLDFFASKSVKEIEERCRFSIYQCSSCKSLMQNVIEIESHFKSEKHREFCAQNVSLVQQLRLNCLVCDGRQVVGDLQFEQHRNSEPHRKALRDFAFRATTKTETTLKNLNSLKCENGQLQPYLSSLNKNAKMLCCKIENLMNLARYLLMFNRNSEQALNLHPCDRSEVISNPDLKKFWNEGLSYILPYSLKKFRGLFLCSACGLVSSNLHTFVLHAVTDLRHLMKCSFKSQLFCCLTCPSLHHFHSYTSFFQSPLTNNCVTKKPYSCISLEPPIMTHTESLVAALETKNDAVKLTDYTGKFHCMTCIHNQVFDNLFAVYEHLDSTKHSSQNSAVSIKCGCCRKTWTSLVALITHLIV